MLPLISYAIFHVNDCAFRLCPISSLMSRWRQKMERMTKMHFFRSNFDEGWEEEGAAFAVYHKGKLVVDLWGGFMEKKCYRVWKKDTMTCLFSLTKVCYSETEIKHRDLYSECWSVMLSNAS